MIINLISVTVRLKTAGVPVSSYLRWHARLNVNLCINVNKFVSLKKPRACDPGFFKVQGRRVAQSRQVEREQSMPVPGSQ